MSAVRRTSFLTPLMRLADLDTTEPALEAPIAPAVAVGSGYSESKWVGERILELASEATCKHQVYHISSRETVL